MAIETDLDLASDLEFVLSCIVFCTKPKEVDPIKHISLRQNISLR